MELDILKGTRDYLPSDEIARQRVADIIKEIFERFGFSPAQTPILNAFETLASKYAGGAEILKETYRLSDQGGRDLALRYDLTVPFARLVGMYQGELPSVFKRYEIGRVFRNGPVKTGRLREFTQCDADVSTPPGVNTAVVDAEFLALAAEVFDHLGIPAYAAVNNRQRLSEHLLACGVPANQIHEAILSVDKFEKIGVEGVADDLRGRGLDPGIAARFAATVERAAAGLADEAAADTPGGRELLALLQAATALGLSVVGLPPVGQRPLASAEGTASASAAVDGPSHAMPVRLNPGLARGLQIYTGTVFEFFWRDPAAPPDYPRPHPAMSSSLGAGGRYDRIIGQFLYPDDPARHDRHPAAGISFGLDVLVTVLGLMTEQANAGSPKVSAPAILTGRRTVTEVLLFAFGPAEMPAVLGMAAQLRQAGVRAEVDIASRKVKASVESAHKTGIAFHAAVGSNEAGRGVMALKHLASGDKAELTAAQAAQRIRAARDQRSLGQL